MKFLNHLKDTVKMGDFFNSYQMLRYQEQTEYRTFTGGLISIGIIITITIAFANMFISTIDRTTINFTQNSIRQADPSRVGIKASSQNKFMFGVEVWGHNLSSQYRYFDVVFEQIQSNFGQNYTKTRYNLQQCTKQHWKMLATVEEDYDKLHMANWLCPTIGTLILLQGKYASQFYHQYSVTLYPCNNATDPSRPCVPRQQTQAFIASNGQFNYFTYYYINSIVNPQQPEYVQYYLEDRQWIIFGSELGAESDMYLTQIQIASDNSIWPFTDYKHQKVYYIDFSPRYFPLSVYNQSCYATFYVMKDPMLHTYNRQVQKIFVVFSFMGGLIGAVMACLFVINIYTSFAYEIALAGKIFKDKESMKTHQLLKNEARGQVNILHFLKYCLYQLAKKFNIKVDWPFIEYIDQCRKEILRQLDIRDLIKRIIFLEYSISYILQDYHLAEMQREITYHPQDVQNLRKKFQSGVDQSEQGSEHSSAQTNKQLMQSNHVMFQKNQAESANQQIASTKRNTNAVAPLDNIHDDKIFVENIDFASLPKLSCKINYNKRLVNIRRLTQSAKEGNIISKKLLDVINSKQIEKQQRKSKQIDLSQLNFTLVKKS